MNIFEINDQIKIWLLKHTDPETGEIVETSNIISELEALELNLKEKQRNVILYYKNLQNEQEIIDLEIERLKRLKLINERKQDNIKKLLQEIMKQRGDTFLDFTTCGAKFKKNPPALIIDVGADLGAYATIEEVVKIDKNAIKSDLKDGKEVKGCRLESGERLDIF